MKKLPESWNSLNSEVGRKAIIAIMMISEIPFPMPFSVIRSPSHITNMVPEVSTITVETMKNVEPITIAWPVAPY